MMSSDWKPALNDVLMDRHGLWRLAEIVPDYNGPIYVLMRHGERAIYDADHLRDRFSPAPALSTPIVGDVFLHSPTQQLWQVMSRGTNEGDEHRLERVGETKDVDRNWGWNVTSVFLYTEFEARPQEKRLFPLPASVAREGEDAGSARRCCSIHASPAYAEWAQERVRLRQAPKATVSLPERNEHWELQVSPCSWEMANGAWYERVSARIQELANIMQGGDGAADPTASDVELKLQQAQTELNKMLTKYHDEAWQHAGCLSLAEGGPGWEQPTGNDSEAMRAVRALRRLYEDERQVAGVLAKEVAELRHLAATNALSRAEGDRIVASWMKRTPPEGVTVQAWQATVLHLAEQLTMGASMDGRLQTHLADAWANLEIYEGERRKLIRRGK